MDSDLNKVCIKCGNSKPATKEYFYWYEYKKVYINICKVCEKERQREYSAKHAKKRAERTKLWRENNTERAVKRDKEWVKNNIERVKATKRKHYIANSEKIKKRSALWTKNNIEKAHVLRNKRNKVRRRTEPKFALDERMSVAIGLSLKKGKGGKSWLELVDFTIKELKTHIEKQFKKGMTWEKFLNGEIHIDHKTPKSAFNYTKPEHEDFKKCWALSNLQPLWKHDNLVKYNKLEKHFQPSLLL